MLNSAHAEFAARVWLLAGRVGNSAPKIADEIMSEVFPRTCSEARHEGAFKMLRVGVISEIKRILRAGENIEGQYDFGDDNSEFAHIISELKSKTYYVESADEYVAVPDLISEPALLDDARKFMRRKGIECIAEAERLDRLYLAVTRAAE